MAIIQIVFDFECVGYGWSESWTAESSQPSLKAFYAASAVPMATKRAAMLAKQARLHAVSVSFAAQKGDSYLRYEPFTGNPAIDCDAPWMTIYTIMRANNDRYRKPVYIRGQDDNATMNGGVFQPGIPNTDFVAKGTIFFDAIVQSGWGWMRNTPGAPKALTGYTVDAQTERVVYTCAAGTFVDPAGSVVYKKVRVLFKGVRSVLNGVQVVRVLSTTSCETLHPKAVFASTIDGTIVVYGDPVHTPAENWNFQKGGRRMPGRPKLHTPGRQRARARG